MAPNMIASIQAAATPKKLGDGTPYSSLSAEQIAALSVDLGLSQKQIEIAALEMEVFPERYARNIKTLSAEDQIRLLESTVSVVGLGGLGGTVTEILARIGIGSLILMDGDVFEDSNLNRQLLSRQKTLCMPKANAAVDRVNQINASVDTTVHKTFLTAENAESLLKGSTLAVDCLDNVKTRFFLEAAAKKMDIPLVSAAVAGAAGHITSIFPQDDGLKLIYGSPDRAREKGVETSLGNLPTIVTVIASLECAEVIKILLNQPDNLRNQLLVIDLIDYTFETMQLT